MLKYIGYILSLEQAQIFAEKQGIDVGPNRPAYNSILTMKLNVWLRKTSRSDVRTVGMDVKKNGVPVYHILWITRMRDGPSTITVYKEEPKDIAVKEWLMTEGCSDLQFTTWLNPSRGPLYMVPEIIGSGEAL